VEQGETLRRMEEAANYNGWLLERGMPYLGSRVLDVGAGTGTFTERLADGRHVVALEPDPAFVPRLRDRFAEHANVEVVAGDVDALARSGEVEPFDSMVCFNVLEHIRDDVGTLRRLRGLLRPNGSLLALVPAHPAAFGSLDAVLGHERRYRKRVLASHLGEAGFELDTLRHVNPVGAIGWFVASRILRAKQIPSAPLRLFDGVVPLLRRLDRFSSPFGLSLWAVAHRRG
jgi:SAM-dependent methyltransferase